jgi:hypothetical protein
MQWPLTSQSHDSFFSMRTIMQSFVLNIFKHLPKQQIMELKNVKFYCDYESIPLGSSFLVMIVPLPTYVQTDC